MAGMQIGSSLIIILRIGPAKGIRKRLPLILNKKLLTLLYAIIIGVNKALEGLLIK